jgi:myo-inositol-1(or 4)-monophosphatase
MVSITLDFIQQVAPIVQQAGALLLSFFNTQLTRTVKDGAGFVTDADLASERYLIEQLKPFIPDSAFFAEESGQTGTGPYRWVIDPLDGTTNFAYGIPYFCISVALTYHDEPLLGIVYDPVRRELFYAAKGEGAFMQSPAKKTPVKLAVSATPTLEESLIITASSYKRDQTFKELMQRTARIAHHVYALRSFGAAALDQALVASGRADGAYFGRLGWWDVAAGMLIVEEAGGNATTFIGDRVRPGFPSFVVGGKAVHALLQEFLK